VAVGEDPPLELLRFRPAEPPPIGPHGRPVARGVVPWTPEEFAAFLAARQRWRETHRTPLPGLPGRERVALNQLGGLPVSLIESERAARDAVRTRIEVGDN
jgi:hypothetical protein